jgi:hypothetical protein
MRRTFRFSSCPTAALPPNGKAVKTTDYLITQAAYERGFPIRVLLLAVLAPYPGLS